MKIVVVYGQTAPGNQGGDPIVMGCYAKPCCDWSKRAWAGKDGYRIHAGFMGGTPYILPTNDHRGMPFCFCPGCGAKVEQLSLGEMEKQQWPTSAT